VLTSFFSQCSGNGIASYYLHDILQSVGVTRSYDQSLVNGGLQIWSFLVAVGFSQLVDRVGRRKLFLIAAVGMLLSFSVWTGCSAVYAQSGNEGAGSAVIAMVFLFYFAAGFAWPGLTVAYVAEILPFNIRAKGMAIGFACTSAASVLNQVRLVARHTKILVPRLTVIPVRQPHRSRETRVALLLRLHRHPCDRSTVRLLFVRRDQRSYLGRNCDFVRRTQCCGGG
jgi:MFS family permease